MSVSDKIMKYNYKTLIDEILNNSCTKATQLHESIYTRVYLVDQEPKLIVKFDKQDIKQIKFDQQLLDALNHGDDLTSLIYYISSVILREESFICTVSKHLPGQALTDYPSPQNVSNIMKAVHEFTRRIHVASDKFRDRDIPNIKEVLTYYLNHTPKCFLKTKLIELLEIPEFNQILNSGEQYLFHGDLWRDNILIADNNVSIIDLTPIFYGPKQMQVAILFSAYFKLNSILLDKPEVFQLDTLMNEWHTPLDRKELLYLMYIFPIAIGLGKEQAFLENPVSKDEYHSIMDPLHRIIHYIDEELKNLQ